ncbi:hypothetical protein BH10PSE13_BH10PSE13_13720 [soil metagenome]
MVYDMLASSAYCVPVMGQQKSRLTGDAILETKGSRGPGSRSAGRWLAGLQSLLAIASVVGLVAVPPASGRMLLLPVHAGGRDGLARIAIEAGARLVDQGPFNGSLVVSGDRAALMAVLVPRHVLVLRAEGGGCGDEGRQ